MFTTSNFTTKPTCAIDSPLGKVSSYISNYSPELLFPIPRKQKRDELKLSYQLPFHGFDTWNAFELSWLNAKGKPVVAIAQFDISCASKNIIESKSLKLYLNSLNNTRFESLQIVEKLLLKDIEKAVVGDVFVKLFTLNELNEQRIEHFSGESLDNLDVTCNVYKVHPNYLSSNRDLLVEERLHSDLLKSNCLVTGQPDWGSLSIYYKGPQINREGLLKYIVSFRDHNEFHEQCVERIFIDLQKHCQPKHLTVEARYSRRGGLDINPIRSTEKIMPAKNIRMPRQ